MSDSVLDTGAIAITTTNQKNIALCFIKKFHSWDFKILDGIGEAEQTPTII